MPSVRMFSARVSPMIGSKAQSRRSSSAASVTSDNLVELALDLKPAELHQRVPLFIGSKDLVAQVETFIRKCDD